MIFLNKSSAKISREEKFAIVFDKYYKYVYKISFNILKDHKLMDDMVQEIFLRIWKAIDSINLDDEDATKGFVARVAVNTTINKYNKDKRISPNISEIDHDTLFAIASDRAANPSDIVADDASVQYIYEKISELGDVYSDVMFYKYKFDMTPEEIANLTGLSIKTVYTKLSRGRELLKAKLYDDERRINNERING